MKYRDLLVTEDGHWQVGKPAREWDLLRTPYYLHRFLTEVEDALSRAIDEADALPVLRLLVRRLITNSYWIYTQNPDPDPKTGVGVRMLYDEVGFPITVQTANMAPGTKSTIHNHGNWGVVAILKGEERNLFWRRVQDPEFKDRIDPVDELILLPGDIISFTSDAIHSIEALGDEPTLTFSIYGETHHSRRFEFNHATHTAKNF
ncbi:MAG: cupin [Leptolyngbyaceae cyanobacterium bins.59]|nr:cupin [Leptolyngbyaceae cyanobacterium bins.59]